MPRLADAESYLAEAQNVARLDHPGIVPVFDVGRTPEGMCYVVSKYISGGSLVSTMSERRPESTFLSLPLSWPQRPFGRRPSELTYPLSFLRKVSEPDHRGECGAWR